MRPTQHRGGIIAAGYSVTWSGDLADELPTPTRPESSASALVHVDEKALVAERAAARHVAYGRPQITRKLLADVLAGLQRL